MCLRYALLGRISDVLISPDRTQGFAVAFEEQQAKIVVGFRLAGQCGLLEQLGGEVAIFF